MRTPREEKLTEQLKLLLPETMLRELQDLALVHDRSVSEYIRHVLGLHIYGHGRIVRGEKRDLKGLRVLIQDSNK